MFSLGDEIMKIIRSQMPNLAKGDVWRCDPADL